MIATEAQVSVKWSSYIKSGLIVLLMVITEKYVVFHTIQPPEALGFDGEKLC